MQANRISAYRTRVLNAVSHALNDIFEDPKAFKFNLAEPFMRSIKGYTILVSGESNDIQWFRTETKKSEYSAGSARCLFLRVDRDHAITVDYKPKSPDDYNNFESYRFEVREMSRSYHTGITNFPFYGGYHWTGNVNIFEDRDSAIEHVRDLLAKAIVKNEAEFSKRILRRSLKGVTAVGVLGTFLWATGAFGEEADPANDVLLEPEQPAARLVLEEPL